MPKNTQADVERGMVTPQKIKKIGMDGAIDDSPAKTAPLTPQSVTIDVQHRNAPRGILGLTRMKSVVMCGAVLGLAGALAYFLLKFFEIPGLNAQIDRLEGEINRLEVENNRFEILNDELNVTVGDIKVINRELNVTANALEETNQELGGKVDELEEQNQIFAAQNGKLNKTVEDLELISAFLDETSQGVVDSLEAISDFLAQQIVQNQELLVGSLENTLRARKDGWNCDFNNVFNGTPYTQDYNVEIPATETNRISDYLENRVLDELCLDAGDFAVFLQLPQYTPLTTNRMNAAMIIYTGQALDWYFPEQNETGLTSEDWSAADFNCENLPAEKKYKFSTT